LESEHDPRPRIRIEQNQETVELLEYLGISGEDKRERCESNLSESAVKAFPKPTNLSVRLISRSLPDRGEALLRLFLYFPNESPRRRRIRYAGCWLRRKVPRALGMAARRLKLSGLNLILLPDRPYLAPGLSFRILSKLEYHKQYCDLSEFAGYCPNTGRYWSYPLNYCPHCSLNLARIRGIRHFPNQTYPLSHLPGFP
jgi:hypothetical protein